MHGKYSDTRAEDKCIIIRHWNSSLRLREGKHCRSSQNKSNIHSVVGGEVTAASRHLSSIRVSYREGKGENLTSTQCDGFFRKFFQFFWRFAQQLSDDSRDFPTQLSCAKMRGFEKTKLHFAGCAVVRGLISKICLK